MPSPPPPTSTTATSLPDELLEEVFLRLPPDEPALLARASLASKLWLGLLSGPRFRRRYGEFHGAPPMLGFLCSRPYSIFPDEEEEPVANFVSTTKFAARAPDDRGYTPWDCRHGRVLLGNHHYKCDMGLIVWDPMTGRWMKLESPARHWAAAVLCAVSDCDHRACHEGPFRVVFAGLDRSHHDDDGYVAHACVYSPETAEWSEQCPDLHLTADPLLDEMPPVLVGNAFHFMLVFVSDDDLHVGILKYDLGSNCLSLVDAPLEGPVARGAAILMAMVDGSLGFAHVDLLTLYVWSRQMGSDGAASWAERAIIDLKNLLPIQNPRIRLRLIGSVEGGDIIFVATDIGIYEINLKSLQWKKLWKRENFRNFCALIPYMSFYSPLGLQNDGNRKKLLEGSSALQRTAVRAHDAAGAAPAGGLPRITEAGEEDLEI